MLDCGRNKCMSLKAAIYDPYLDTLGGGERYCLTVSEILLKHGYEVDIFWSGDQEIISQAEKRFGLQLDGLKCVPDIFGLVHQKIEMIEDNSKELLYSKSYPKANFFEKITKFINKYKILSKYDFVFYLSDGSIPFLFSKKNFLHIQVPFVKRESFKERVVNFIKVRLINYVVCNSQFTSKFINDFSKEKLCVLYPPVDVEKFYSSEAKEDIILSVGRFDNILNAKKQDVLIEAFKKIINKNPGIKWKLVLMGGSHDLPQENHYLQHLKHMSADYPIEFIVNPDFDQLKKIYSISKIYWHAAGYGVDEYIHPEQTEHFGMTVVEAMDSGLVPMVVAKGGLTEIVLDSKNGYIWQTLDELIAKTQLLLVTPKNLKELSHQAHLSSKSFSKEIFEKKLLDLIKQ